MHSKQYYSFLDIIVPYQDTLMSYQDILHLSECGLINSSALLFLNLPFLKIEEPAFLVNNEYVLLISSKGERAMLKIPQYPLTIPRTELFSLF